MGKYTRKKRGSKRTTDRPPKPYPKFPLTPHPGGAWQKKILGRIHYFGRWGHIRNGKMERLPGDGWKEALELYKVQADDLHAGRTPRVKRTGEGTTLDLLRGRFLTAKSRALDAHEITPRTYFEYKATTNLLIEQFGKDRLVDDITADDFETLRDGMAKRWGPVRLGNEIQKIKTFFKYGYETGLIDKPIRYGPQFKKPSASVLRRHRAKNGERMFQAAELCRLLDSLGTNPIMRSMILLGINAGFNNSDCANLPLKALDLDGGWCNFPRPKTGIARRCPLWPETVTALREVIGTRPEPRNEEATPLVFVTTRGRPWLTLGTANPVSVAARNAMKAVGVHREGIGFATLRHMFRTVADGSRDQVAIDLMMGHSDPSMGAVYRERIDDARLWAVVEHVKNWLFGEGG